VGAISQIYLGVNVLSGNTKTKVDYWPLNIPTFLSLDLAKPEQWSFHCDFCAGIILKSEANPVASITGEVFDIGGIDGAVIRPCINFGW
jgi:hypothetical protein